MSSAGPLVQAAYELLTKVFTGGFTTITISADNPRFGCGGRPGTSAALREILRLAR